MSGWSAGEPPEQARWRTVDGDVTNRLESPIQPPMGDAVEDIHRSKKAPANGAPRWKSGNLDEMGAASGSPGAAFLVRDDQAAPPTSARNRSPYSGCSSRNERSGLVRAHIRASPSDAIARSSHDNDSSACPMRAWTRAL